MSWNSDLRNQTRMLEIICLEHIDHIAKTYDLQLQYLVYMIILYIYIYIYVYIHI